MSDFTITKARKILGPSSKYYSDKELEIIIKNLSDISELIINNIYETGSKNKLGVIDSKKGGNHNG